MIQFFKNIFARRKGRFQALALPQPGPIALRAARDAEDPKVLDVREVGNNSGKWVEIYLKAVNLLRGNPWCQAFVVYRLVTAAHFLGKTVPASFPRSGSTVVVSGWFKKNGLWISRQSVVNGKAGIKPGDIAYFFFASKGRIAHTGLVVDVESNGFWSIEGNTGPGPGVEREGQGVYKKFRTWSNLGLLGGFGRFPY